MTDRRLSLFACLLLMSVILSAPARADEVRMKNGDRLSGQIQRMEEGELLFRAAYCEERLRLDWQQIDCVIVDRPLPLTFADNELFLGTLTCPQEGMVQVDSPLFGPSRPIPLAKLQAINPSTYSGLLTLGGIYNSGNTDTRSLSLATRFLIRTHKHRFTVEAKHNSATANGETTARNSSGSLKYDFFTTRKLYSYAQSLTEQDALANLNLRNTEGLGFGYQFFDTRRLSLFLEAGGSFFNEDVKVGEDHREAAGRWAAGLDWEVIRRSLKLFHRQEGYYSFDTAAVVLRSEQGLRLHLADDFSVTFEADYRYNGSPEPGKKSSDLALILGLTYEYAYW